MSSIVASSFTHVYIATSGAGTALGAAAQVGDVIVLMCSDAGNQHATAACSGATATFNEQKFQLSNNGSSTSGTCLTAEVTVAGTPTVAVTSAGGDLGWSAWLVRGLSSATAHAVNSANFPNDASPESASVTTTVICSLFVLWANESADMFTSWLLGVTQLNHDTGHWDANAYLLDQATGTYAMGANVSGTSGIASVVITLALPNSGGGGGGSTNLMGQACL